MEHPDYRLNLEQVLAFTGGAQMLSVGDVRKFTGMRDSRTLHKHFQFINGYISAAALARQLCTGRPE